MSSIPSGPPIPEGPSVRCHHVRVNGVRCGSPALRTKRYCYYHQRTRPVLLETRRPNSNDTMPFGLPILEDAYAIQATLRTVAQHLLEGFISEKKAGLMLYALQIASSNLKQMKAETPQPDQVVVDLPRLSEIPPLTPTPEPVRMNSHTARLTRYPGPPTAEEEYEDDLLREAREMREEAEAFKRAVEYRPAPPASTNPSGTNEEGESKSYAGESESNDGLPPGTIQASAKSRRPERRHVN